MIDQKISLRSAALLAGIGYVLMMATPFAEFYVMARLVVPGKIGETAQNILGNEALFRYGIFAYIVNFIGDILAAWALYILLKPVNSGLSLLAAWLRLLYTALSLAALLNVVPILKLLHAEQYTSVFTPEQVNAMVDISVAAFRQGWSVAYIFFGPHLLLLGYLVIRSGYIPKWIGAWLMITGLGWLVYHLRPLLFPGLKIDFTIIAIVGLGELAFMVWLLVFGRKIKEQQ